MPLSERLRRLSKVGASAGFGFIVFVVVFYLTLPYGRFKDYIAAQVLTFGYEMEAKEAGPSLGLGMRMKDVSLVSSSSGAAKPTRILIDKAKLGVSFLSYLIGNKAFSLSADVFKGEIDANVKMSKDDTKLESKAAEIDLAEVPWVKSMINLPTSGRLDVKLDLSIPKKHLSESKGSLGWECSACALGDGKAKLVIASNPLLAEGLGLPKIRLGDFSGKVVIDKGVGRLQNVQFKSQDLEASIEGEIHLAQPVATSRVDLYIRFKLSDSLLRSSEKLRTIMDLTAQMGKRPDGFLGLRVVGSFQNMGNVQWAKTSPFLSAPAPAKPTPKAPVAAPVHPPAGPPHPPAPAPAPPAAPPAAPPIQEIAQVAPPPPPPPPTPPPPPPPPPTVTATTPPPPSTVPPSPPTAPPVIPPATSQVPAPAVPAASAPPPPPQAGSVTPPPGAAPAPPGAAPPPGTPPPPSPSSAPSAESEPK